MNSRITGASERRLSDMMTTPKISICIPAYKRTEFLQRLLESLSSQTYRQFEVIITDDSPDGSVEKLAATYQNRLPRLRYWRNPTALGTPANWNKAISLASGEWIKLMHDDDWFSRNDSLKLFAEAAEANPDSFIFCAYTDVFLDKPLEKPRRPGRFRLRQLEKEPASILSKNVIGPPSVVLYPNKVEHVYDEALKWLVDVDMYIRLLPGLGLHYLPEHLVNVGVGQEQVTATTHGNPEVEIPEHRYMIRKLAATAFSNILVYDYWWRFVRNFDLGDREPQRGFLQQWPPVIQRMIRWQSRIPRRLLKNGIISKTLMALHFFINRNKPAL